eukprot:4500988-Prymnesium_polylepis.1
MPSTGPAKRREQQQLRRAVRCRLGRHGRHSSSTDSGWAGRIRKSCNDDAACPGVGTRRVSEDIERRWRQRQWRL